MDATKRQMVLQKTPLLYCGCFEIRIVSSVTHWKILRFSNRALDSLRLN